MVEMILSWYCPNDCDRKTVIKEDFSVLKESIINGIITISSPLSVSAPMSDFYEIHYSYDFSKYEKLKLIVDEVKVKEDQESIKRLIFFKSNK